MKCESASPLHHCQPPTPPPRLKKRVNSYRPEEGQVFFPSPSPGRTNLNSTRRRLIKSSSLVLSHQRSGPRISSRLYLLERVAALQHPLDAGQEINLITASELA